MIILGIDPGTAITGYGIVSMKGNKFSPVEFGAIRTASDLPLANRLEKIYCQLEDLIIKHNPEHIAIEELFFNKNVKTALAVGHARGVVMLAAVKKGMEIFHYTPLQVKQAVVGYGRAEKEQVQYMVKGILGLPKVPKPDDVADALAIAICHGHSNSFNNRLVQMGESKC
ncbi:MAG: crossover junction endodeoxyribonuclease RuvC [Bacillota bacterium]|nr:crossover junction endodeoxyribonuclease RuvC [Bacillota bacterium]